MSGSRFVTNITGGTIGAIAIGDGARAEGCVTSNASSPARFRATVDVRGAASIRNVAAMLEDVAARLREGATTGAIGRVSGADPSGVAWTVKEEQ